MPASERSAASASTLKLVSVLDGRFRCANVLIDPYYLRELPYKLEGTSTVGALV